MQVETQEKQTRQSKYEEVKKEIAELRSIVERLVKMVAVIDSHIDANSPSYRKQID